ncbi:MAG: hypothetical protein QF685_03250 [Verrucomicrobiota bacterium]|nr:hypothetical protein [Verrucomicrobiota bacterium]
MAAKLSDAARACHAKARVSPGHPHGLLLQMYKKRRRFGQDHHAAG